MTDSQHEIISGLSEEIATHLGRAASEQRNPGADPDRMDDIIKEGLETAKKLRKIRDDLEVIFTKVIL